MTEIPDELRSVFGMPEAEDADNKPYTAHDLVLSYLAHHDGGTVNQLLMYLYQINGKATKRDYLYHVLCRLRKRGLLRTRDPRSPTSARHFVTMEGVKQARPYMEVDNGE